MKKSACLILVFVIGILGCQGAQGDRGGRGEQGPSGVMGLPAYQSGSRLDARIEAGEDGARAFVGWYDSRLHVDCQFARATDGQTRCLPTPRESLNMTTIVYGDPQCSAPMLAFARLCDNPDGAVPEYVRFLAGDACEGWHVRAVGDQIAAGNDIYAWHSGVCSPVPAPSGPSYELGSDLPPETFVHGGTSVE